jgi:hypothetical protein
MILIHEHRIGDGRTHRSNRRGLNALVQREVWLIVRGPILQDLSHFIPRLVCEYFIWRRRGLSLNTATIVLSVYYYRSHILIVWRLAIDKMSERCLLHFRVYVYMGIDPRHFIETKSAGIEHLIIVLIPSLMSILAPLHLHFIVPVLWRGLRGASLDDRVIVTTGV